MKLKKILISLFITLLQTIIVNAETFSNNTNSVTSNEDKKTIEANKKKNIKKRKKIVLDYTKTEKNNNKLISDFDRRVNEADSESSEYRQHRRTNKSNSPILSSVSIVNNPPENNKSSFHLFFNLNGSTEMVKSQDKNTHLFEYLLNPTYDLSKNYKIAASLAGNYDSIVNNGDVQTSSVSFIHNGLELGNMFILSPAVRAYFPANNSQRSDSYLFGTGLRFLLSSTDTAFGSDRYSLQATISFNKGYYEYKTKLPAQPTATDPTPADQYNNNYIIEEKLNFSIKLFSIYSISFGFTDDQLWDFNGVSQNTYETSENLNLQFNDNVSAYLGIANDDNLYNKDRVVDVRLYDKTAGNSRANIGFSLAF